MHTRTPGNALLITQNVILFLEMTPFFLLGKNKGMITSCFPRLKQICSDRPHLFPDFAIYFPRFSTPRLRGRVISAPPFGCRWFGNGQLGAVPFRRRTSGRRFLIIFHFLSYEEKTMRQDIPWMTLSTNLFRLESSILTRGKRARNRNNVAAENLI